MKKAGETAVVKVLRDGKELDLEVEVNPVRNAFSPATCSAALPLLPFKFMRMDTSALSRLCGRQVWKPTGEVSHSL